MKTKLPVLDLWLAVDEKIDAEKLKTNIEGSIYLFYKKPYMAKPLFTDYKYTFIEDDDEGECSIIFSLKSIKIKNINIPHKLYISEKRHKENARTFWLVTVGYQKYILTNMFPIKGSSGVEVVEQRRQYIHMFINNYKCRARNFICDGMLCSDCIYFKYCKKIYDNNYLTYKKIYLHFIENGKTVYI